MGLLVGLFVTLFAGSARWLRAQEIQLGQTATLRRQHVELETQTVQVRAGRPDWVELRFRVDPGLHINSHTPHDELLVATTLELTPAEQGRILGQEYPAGIPLRLDVGSGATLSTYQGGFQVRVQLLVPRGQTILAGQLHYQACDERSCFPPRSLPVRVVLTAR